jgi:predicted RecB family nuclease
MLKSEFATTKYFFYRTRILLITDKIFIEFLKCKYKAYLKIKGLQGHVSEYQELQDYLEEQYRINARNRLCEHTDNVRYTTNKPNHSDITFEVHIKTIEYSALIHALQLQPRSHSSIKKSAYVPIMFSPLGNISKYDRNLLAFWGLTLSKMKTELPAFGRIVHGRKYVNTKVDIAKLYGQINHILSDLAQLKHIKKPPQLYLNKHCAICEFKERCHSLAIEQSNLSLLRGLSQKNITKINSKGIFTIAQYSYTFRPQRKRPVKYRKKNFPALQALALRENEIYVYETPELPKSVVNIYFDVEGIPDRRSYYLIGVLIESDKRVEEFSFWAKGEDEELEIFRRFISILSKYEDYTLYHFGNYEITYLKHMSKNFSTFKKKKIDKVLMRCCNLLSFFHSNIYLPLYSNGLKDIGQYLGYKWKRNFSKTGGNF